MSERVSVPLPRPVYRLLARVADSRGTNVGAILAVIAERYAQHLQQQPPPGARAVVVSTRVTALEQEQALTAYETGEPTVSIAARLGVSTRTVALWVSKAGIGAQNHQRAMITDEQKATITRMWDQGATVEQIGVIAGVSSSTVSNWSKRLGCTPRTPGRRRVDNNRTETAR